MILYSALESASTSAQEQVNEEEQAEGIKWKFNGPFYSKEGTKLKKLSRNLFIVS